ncbi:MAG: hypothetical protein K2X94_05060 [Amoebophilaceae bacterium]|nr:hypothetical protein [Amoebophilaceae bacterium]
MQTFFLLLFSCLVCTTCMGMDQQQPIKIDSQPAAEDSCQEQAAYTMEVTSHPYQADGEAKEYVINDNGVRLTYHKVLTLLKTCSIFRSFVIDFFKNIPYNAYFWETVPVSVHEWQNKVFQFVVISTTALSHRSPDREHFKDHFIRAENQNKKVISFQSLGKDAFLIAPCPNQAANYGHIAAFVKYAPLAQQHALWMKIGEEMSKVIQEAKGQKKWLSTAGEGISWLHVRIDSRPKYYKYTLYKQ